MNSKRNNAGENGGGGGRVNQASNTPAGGAHRKPGVASSPGKAGARVDRTEHAHDIRSTTVSVSSLRSRLGPTIRSALSSAVETLLGEIAAVMSETEDELLSKERENERLKARLDTSERELKTLQECLCSAQKLIDQLQGPFNTHPPLPSPMPGQHGYANPAQPPNAARLTHRGAGDDTDPRCFSNSEAELSGALGDAIHGFEARDEFKSCHLSIQADGTVTNSYYDPMTVHASGMCHDVNRAGEMSDRRLSHPSSHSPYGVKEEQVGPTSGPVRVRGDGEHGGQSECDQGYGHMVEEQGVPRSRRQTAKHTPSSGSHNGPSSSSAGTPPQGPPGLRTSSRVVSGTSSRQSPGTSDSSPDGRRHRRPPTELMGEVAGDRPHLCLECGKTFRLLSSLKKHLRIHTGEKPYPCSVCGRRFRESGALKTHLRIHTGEKPYACSECGARFRHLDGLRKHGRTHTGEKPYACGVCGKRLSRLQHLKHHQRIHTGERPCRCPLCQRSFQDAASLRKHLISVHQGEAGAEEAHERMAGSQLGEHDLQGSVEDEEIRFEMWEEERDEGDAAVDCV
ncbi:zinc finger protein GLI4 [Silurus meridionalis]|uniref:zinc finger protein GLI4 n=1 Tax=Silurus meridionalis TaxID=175797 RepID=UPI001EEAA056|nr:zinc finger protein GLI4 [Silurus meridionalis]KAI5089550.1 B-cell CLL/lymphoma 6 member B protein [Silurus meridionalis]